jgi:hypothetical protein
MHYDVIGLCEIRVVQNEGTSRVVPHIQCAIFTINLQILLKLGTGVDYLQKLTELVGDFIGPVEIGTL